MQAFFFLFAALFQTDKLTDFTYGMTFVLVSLIFLTQGGLGARELILNGSVIVWGLRLAAYLFIRILKIKRDERFDGRRENFVRFAAFWILQGVVIWVVLLPVTILSAERDSSRIGFFELLGFSTFCVGFIIETIADAQKFSFRSRDENKGRWIESGLWKYSQYPNYFGEILLWWGLFVAALPGLSGWLWLSVASPVTITLVLLKVSGIPLLEEGHRKKYGGDPKWLDYVRRTPLLIPLPPGKKEGSA